MQYIVIVSIIQIGLRFSLAHHRTDFGLVLNHPVWDKSVDRLVDALKKCEFAWHKKCSLYFGGVTLSHKIVAEDDPTQGNSNLLRSIWTSSTRWKKPYRKNRGSNSGWGKVFNYLSGALMMLEDIELLGHLSKVTRVTGTISLWTGEANSSSTSVVEHTTAGPNLNFEG